MEQVSSTSKMASYFKSFIIKGCLALIIFSILVQYRYKDTDESLHIETLSTKTREDPMEVKKLFVREFNPMKIMKKDVLVLGANTAVGFHTVKTLLKQNLKRVIAAVDYRGENFDELMNVRANNLREYYYYHKSFTFIEEELHTCSKNAASQVAKLLEQYQVSHLIITEQISKCTLSFLTKLSEKVTDDLDKIIVVQTDPHGLNQLTDPPLNMNNKLKSLSIPISELIFQCVPLGSLSSSSVAYRWIQGLTLQQDIYMIPGEQRVCNLEDIANAIKESLKVKSSKDTMYMGARILHSELLTMIEKTLKVVRSNRIHTQYADKWIKYIRGNSHPTQHQYTDRIDFLAAPSNPNEHGIDTHYTVANLNPAENAAEQAVNALIKWFKNYHFPRNIVLTSYMVMDHDAQDHSSRWTIRFENMFLFYRSVHKLRADPFQPADFTAFICQAGVDEEFIKKYSTSSVRFIAVNGYNYRNSVNDERFFVFQEFLQQNPYKPDYVIYTDLFDVLFFHNPFEFIHENSCFKAKDYSTLVEDRYILPPSNAVVPPKKKAKLSKMCYDFFPGRDEPWMTMYSSTWIRRKFGMCDMELPARFSESPLLNAGVMGANYEFFMDFLQEMTAELLRRPIAQNCNMGVFNFVLHTLYSGRFFAGSPFTSPFTRESSDTNNYIKHK